LIVGHTSREIANTAGVSEATVRGTVASLMRKISCTRKSARVRLASLLL